MPASLPASSSARLARLGAAVTAALIGLACGRPAPAAPTPARTATPGGPAPSTTPPTAAPVPTAPGAETAELRDFDFVVDYMARNYAGHDDKVAGHERELEDLTAATREAIAADPSSAMTSLVTWLEWFRDRHVWLEPMPDGLTAPPTPEQLAAMEREWSTLGERVEVPRAELAAAERAGGRGRPGDPYAGVWESDDGVYRILVRKDAPDRWKGVVVATSTGAWAPGQIKFEITAATDGVRGVYRMRNHRDTPSRVSVLAGGDLLRFDDAYAHLRRAGAKVELERYAPPRAFFLRPVSPTTLWLRLPDFRAEHRAEIEGLLAKNAELLARTPNLIIDVRNNEGGTDWAYGELMKWLYTRPIYRVGVQFRATADNARALEQLESDAADQREFVRALVAKMRAATGPWMTFDEGRPLDIVREPEIRPYPQQVGILITRAGSSGEQFVMDARFSSKVTLFGGNTAGILDYSNVLSVPLPSGRYTLHYSSTRSMRLPEEAIDNVGIPPDIRLDDTVDDPIAFVQRWLEARTAADAAARRPPDASGHRDAGRAR